MMYRALLWKERQRAHREVQAGDGDPSNHLVTGQRGETMAYWYLRRAGYTIVARNSQARGGELDLVGWDGPVLAFVEVKTRSSLEAGQPEEAVTREKQRRVAVAAKQYLKRLRKKPQGVRFDIVSVYWSPQAGVQVRLTKDAFKA